jgi:hypothetical protein
MLYQGMLFNFCLRPVSEADAEGLGTTKFESASAMLQKCFHKCVINA